MAEQSPESRSTGKVAVVTGASSGIGAATARRLADEGFRVVLVARRSERIDALAEEIGEAAVSRTLDVTDRAAVDAFAASLDRVDLLVNNAGGAFGAHSVEQGDPADWRRMYEVNVMGVLHMTQALLPALRASGEGTVLVMSSTAALAPYEGGGGYVAAKAGAHAIAGTLRLELVAEPIRVIEIARVHGGLRRVRGRRRTADGGGRRRHRRLDRDPPGPCQHRPAGGPPARPGRRPQGPPRGLSPHRPFTFRQPSHHSAARVST
jgi:NADP-dependent 3-hydroxy acid dehydrogenase YdfG